MSDLEVSVVPIQIIIIINIGVFKNRFSVLQCSWKFMNDAYIILDRSDQFSRTFQFPSQ